LNSSGIGEKWQYNGTVPQLFRDFEQAYDSVRREVFYNILTEFCITMKIVTLIKTCSNETYSKFRIGKHLRYEFPIENGLKQGNALSSLLLNFAKNIPAVSTRGTCAMHGTSWS